MKQPEVGDKVQYISDVDGDGWPELGSGKLTECTVDWLTVDKKHKLNPDHCQDLHVGKLFVGLWRYVS